MKSLLLAVATVVTICGLVLPLVPTGPVHAQTPPSLYVGEVVHFVKGSCTTGCHRAAMIVGIEADEPNEAREVTVAVFWSTYSDDPSGSGSQGHVASQRAYVPYDPTGTQPYSWHHLADDE